jgi:WD40 repeat protein
MESLAMRTLRIPRGNFDGVFYQPDGKYLISVNSTWEVRWWDLRTFEERLTVRLKEPSGRSHGFAVTLGQAWLGVGGNLFDLSPAFARLNSADATPDRLSLSKITLSDRLLEYQPLQVATNGSVIVDIQNHHTLVGSRRNRRYVAHIEIWNRPDKSPRRIEAAHQLFGFSLDRTGELLAGGEERTVFVHTLTTGNELHAFEHTDQGHVTCFSPDGRLLAVGAGRTVWLWDLNNGTNIARFPSFRRYCESLAFHPTASILAAGGRDGEVRIYDIRKVAETMRFDWDIGAVHGLAFAPDGSTAAAAGHNNAVVVWDLD